MYGILAFTMMVVVNEIIESFKFVKVEFHPQLTELEIKYQMHGGMKIEPETEVHTLILGNRNETKKYVNDEAHYEHMGGIFFLETALDHTNATYVEVPYVYACSYGGCVRPEGRLNLYEVSNMLPRFGESGEVVGAYHDVIASGSRWSSMYGHWIFDCVLPLLFIPQDIIKRAVYCLPVNSSIYRGALEVLGFKPENVLYLNSSQWVFAEHFHTVFTPEMVHGCMVWCNQEFSKRAKTLYGCLEIKSTEYAFYNRPKGNRHLYNIEDFIFAASVRFPDIRWIQLMTLYPTFKDSVVAYSSVKLLFGPTGSNWANMLFMNPNTAACCGVGDMNDGPVYGAAEESNIWMITFLVPGMRHHGLKKNILNYEVALKAIEKALFVLEHQRWPTNTEVPPIPN